MLKRLLLLSLFSVAAAAAEHGAFRPTETSTDAVALPQSDEIPQGRSSLAAIHARALRILPLVRGAYAVTYNEGDEVHPRNIAAAIMRADSVMLVRSLMDGSPNLVSTYGGSAPARTWRADGPWGSVFFDGDTLVAVTAPSPARGRGIEPRWERVRFER